MGRDKHWAIFRCAGSKTIKVADSLSAAGFTCWTPRETIKRRIPRKRGIDSIVVPIMPTFGFVHAKHLADILALAQAFKHSIPDFSVQHYGDSIPLVADSDLDPLRVAERKGTPLEKVAQLSPGDQVRLTEGGFSGMTGIVETSAGKFTMVCFPQFSIPIKISTLHLLPESDKPAQHSASWAA